MREYWKELKTKETKEDMINEAKKRAEIAKEGIVNNANCRYDHKHRKAKVEKNLESNTKKKSKKIEERKMEFEEKLVKINSKR